MKIFKDDLVIVISGNFRGSGPAKVVSVNRKLGLVKVDGINTRLKHVKRGHPRSPQGGRLTTAMPVPLSKLMLFCKICNKGSRQRVALLDGRKSRVCDSCRSHF